MARSASASKEHGAATDSTSSDSRITSDRATPSDRRHGLGPYLLAAVLVRLVDEGSRVALVLLALDRTGNAGIGGLLVAALLIPHVAAAPVIGWCTDRARRPRLFLSAAAAGFAICLGTSALLLEAVPLPLVVAVLVIGGCCGPALTGGLTSQLSGLVSESGLPRAFGADSLTYNVSGIAGPAIAGVLVATVGSGPGTVSLAAIACLGAVAIAFIPIGRIEATESTGAATAGDGTGAGGPSLSGGARAIIAEPVLRTVTLASSLGQLGPGALAIVAAVLAQAQGQPAATGWLLSAAAGGGLLGSLGWTWRPAADHHAPRTVMLALVGIGIPLVLAATTTNSLVATAVLFAVSGAFLGPFTGALFLTRQQHAPAPVRAQVFTISAGLKTTTAAAGAALGGAVAHVPSSVQLVLVGASPIIAGVAGALLLLLAGRNGGRGS